MAKEKEKKEFTDIIVNLPFHNFEENPEFIGIYNNTVKLGEDTENQFDANIFTSVETGEQVYITDSYSINKAIKKIKESGMNPSDVVLSLKYLGKTEVKGKPFNQFKIGYMSKDDWKEHISS